MKILKYILFLLLIGIIGVSVYIAVQPNTFKITRTRNIKAPKSLIYNNVIDLKNWEAWSPWVENDPSTKISLGEQTKGVNGNYSWTNQQGIGTMTIKEATPDTFIKQRLQFAEYPASNITWNFSSNKNGSTDVTWSIAGENLPFAFKAYTAFFKSMEDQEGPNFERGLEKLDSLIINSMKVYNISIDNITEYGGGFYLYQTTSTTSSNISQVMSKQYDEIKEYMKQNNIASSGMPFTIYDKVDNESGSIIMSNAIPVMTKVDLTDSGKILCGYIPKTRTFKTTLKGNYSNLPEAWKTAMMHLTQNNLEQSEIKPFEIYTNNSKNLPNPADWVTEIYIPIKE